MACGQSKESQGVMTAKLIFVEGLADIGFRFYTIFLYDHDIRIGGSDSEDFEWAPLSMKFRMNYATLCYRGPNPKRWFMRGGINAGAAGMSVGNEKLNCESLKELKHKDLIKFSMSNGKMSPLVYRFEYENVYLTMETLHEERFIRWMAEDVEQEFGCSICTEIFILPTSASCGHTFCQYCVTEWKKNTDKCPICRKDLGKLAKNFTVDNYLGRIYHKLPGVLGTSRKQIIEERMQKAMGVEVNELPPLLIDNGDQHQRSLHPNAQQRLQNANAQQLVRNINGQLPGQNIDGQLPVQNINGQLPGQNINGQLPGQNTIGRLPGQNTNGQLPGQNMNGQLSWQNTNGQQRAQEDTNASQPRGQVTNASQPRAQVTNGSQPGAEVTNGLQGPPY